MLAMLILLIGCKKEAAHEVTAPEAPPESETPASEVPKAQIETIYGVEMLSEARCIGNNIELILTNPTDSAITLGKDALLHINGMLTSYPDCDKMEIAPGESIYCADITGPLAIRKGEDNKIQINMKTARSVNIVKCQAE